MYFDGSGIELLLLLVATPLIIVGINKVANMGEELVRTIVEGE